MTLSDTSPSSPLPSPPRRAAELRSRRRRRARFNIPRDAEGRAALLASLARRAYPTYELFVYAALSGAILGLGFVLDSRALLLFGVLIAPLLLPWVGLLLAAVTGSIRFFFETIVALLLSAALVFLIGVVAGLAARAVAPRTFAEAFAHSRLWWPDLIVLALGAIILTVSFVRSEAKPFLPSVLLAYEFFLPLGAGGFGLGSGIGELWPYGLLVFVVHFAWASMFGLLTLAALRITPSTAAAFVFSAAIAFVLLAVLVILMSGGGWAAPSGGSVGLSNPGPVPRANPPVALVDNPSPTALVESPTAALVPLDTPMPPTVVATEPPTATATVTMTIEPTPIYAMVQTPKGTALRESPGGKVITGLDNFTYVELLPETQQVSGYAWAHVVALINGNRLEGWVVRQFLVTATPNPPGASPAAPAVTPTP
jgi:Domain of unknown function (DUF389)